MSEVATEYSLRYLGDPVLEEMTSFVDTSFDVDPGLISAMRFIMKAKRGAGLAAPQVGVSKRICLVTVDKTIRVLINPVILSRSAVMDQEKEGCLSIPNFYTAITRSRYIGVEYLTENFKKVAMVLEGFEARCVLHEIDHLEGKLITKGLSRTQMRLARGCVEAAQNGIRG